MSSVTWTGAKDLEPLLVPIESVTRHDVNPRRGDVAIIAEVLHRFGQLKPVVVDANGKIVAGNHVHLAAQERLGWSHVAAVRADHLDVGEAYRYLLADNRTSDAASYDFAEYAATLRALVDGVEEPDWRSLGFQSRSEYEHILAAADRTAAKGASPDGWAGGDQGLATDHRCRVEGCGYEWSGTSA